MKKIIALVMCFSVVLLSACGAYETSKSNSEIADTAETTTETTTAATTSETTTIETTTAAATSETTTIETTATFSTAKSNFNDNDENNSDYANYNEKLKQADECFSILDEIYHMPTATAGYGLRTIIASAHFLNWTESTTMTDDEIAAIAKYYFSSINSYTDTEIYLPMLHINFNNAFKNCESIVNKDCDRLGDIGNPQKYDSYSMDKYIRCRNIIQQYLSLIPREKTPLDKYY